MPPPLFPLGRVVEKYNSPSISNISSIFDLCNLFSALSQTSQHKLTSTCRSKKSSLKFCTFGKRLRILHTVTTGRWWATEAFPTIRLFIGLSRHELSRRELLRCGGSTDRMDTFPSNWSKSLIILAQSHSDRKSGDISSPPSTSFPDCCRKC